MGHSSNAREAASTVPERLGWLHASNAGLGRYEPLLDASKKYWSKLYDTSQYSNAEYQLLHYSTVQYSTVQ